MSLAVLVNTCDKFRDCWDPFFRLWEKFGLSEAECRVYLNTEYADYTYPNVAVTPLRVCVAGHWAQPKPPTWSWCLRQALQGIEEDFVLYLQEDYFLDKPADAEAISRYVRQMQQDDSIDCIHLTHCTFHAAEECTKEGLRPGDRSDWYYTNCQAAIWRRSCLSELIREHEDAWQFERWASKRARVLGKAYYVADFKPENAPLSYLITGVIQGKWYEPVVKLFADNGIAVDYSVRGFYEGPFGKKKGRLLAYYCSYARWAVRSVFARYLFPLRSRTEIWKLRLSANGNARRNR